MTVRKRNLKLSHVQKVEPQIYADKIRVQVLGRSTGIEWTCTLELDFYSAARIIRDMRKALRQVRDGKSALLNAAVEHAEEPL